MQWRTMVLTTSLGAFWSTRYRTAPCSQRSPVQQQWRFYLISSPATLPSSPKGFATSSYLASHRDIWSRIPTCACGQVLCYCRYSKLYLHDAAILFWCVIPATASISPHPLVFTHSRRTRSNVSVQDFASLMHPWIRRSVYNRGQTRTIHEVKLR